VARKFFPWGFSGLAAVLLGRAWLVRAWPEEYNDTRPSLDL
jgi:hypothetical protein